jgi:hypothetical protein
MMTRTTRREANRLRMEIREGMEERQETRSSARRIRRCGTLAGGFDRWSVPGALAAMLPWTLLALVPHGTSACLN